jgi:hypothetical protein
LRQIYEYVADKRTSVTKDVAEYFLAQNQPFWTNVGWKQNPEEWTNGNNFFRYFYACYVYYIAKILALRVPRLQVGELALVEQNEPIAGTPLDELIDGFDGGIGSVKLSKETADARSERRLRSRHQNFNNNRRRVESSSSEYDSEDESD